MSSLALKGARDAAIVLANYTNHTLWLLQLKANPEFYDIGDIGDSDGTREPQARAFPLILLRVIDYEPTGSLPSTINVVGSSQTRRGSPQS
jgi:hypothetical protein